MMVKTSLRMSALVLVLTAQAGATADTVFKKGFIQCGVNTGLAGFSQPDGNGEWRGIDVDLCRAVAAALLGDGSIRLSFF
jgi:general L-amino acid transport system substrate-binding protein